MGETKPVEIICSACGADTLLVRRPNYDGLTRVGETLSCASCGHVYPTEQEVPFKDKKPLQVFTEADHSSKIKLFRDDENSRLCRYCANYVINPFMQWCALHKKEVEATDTCAQFSKKKTGTAAGDTKAGAGPIIVKKPLF